MLPVRISRRVFDPLPDHRDGRRPVRFALCVSSHWLLLALAVGTLPALASEAQQVGRPHRIRFEMAVNLKTVSALGLTIPQSVLVLADKVIR